MLLFVGAVVIIVLATLLPNFHPGPVSTGFCIFCGERGAADFLANVALFGPLGVALALRGHRFLRAAASGAAFSLLIELAQLSLIPGRDSTAGDLVANTVGTALGWALVVLLWTRLAHERGRAIAGSVAAVTLALLVCVGGALLFRPAFPSGPVFLQWAAQFGNMAHFNGQVLATTIGEARQRGPGPLPPELGRLLLAGAPLQAELVAGSEPEGLAPVVSIFDDAQREVWLLGAEYDHVVFRQRTLGRQLRLDAAEVRFDDALEGVRPGERIVLALMADRKAVCLNAGGHLGCRRAPGAADTWRLLHGARWWPAGARTMASAFWLIALFFPAGVLAPDLRSRALVAAGGALVLVAAPLLLSLPATPPAAVLAASIGVLAGGWVRALRERRDLPQAAAPSLLVR